MKTCMLWTLHHHRAPEYNIPLTGHKKFKSNTAPYVPQNKKWRCLGICLQSFIIAGGACKVNWANLIFMVEPIATVMRSSFSLHQTPIHVLWLVFFTGNRTLIPHSISVVIGLLVKTNSDCQAFPQQLEKLLSSGICCFSFEISRLSRCYPAITVFCSCDSHSQQL